MPDRLLRVNAYTTLDMASVTTLRRRADGTDGDHSAVDTETLGVVNATADRRAPDEVRLEVEADHTETGLPAHAERVHLTPDEAEELAAALERHAGRVRAAGENGEDAEAGDTDDASGDETNADDTQPDAA